MAPLIISISGLRGIVGQSLTPQVALAYGMAFGSFLSKRKGDKQKPCVCVGRDSRPSGGMVAASVQAGLMAVGCDVVDLGIVTTPGAALMTRQLSCDGGVVITASHNPVAWNGIKLLRRDGIAFPAAQAKEIQRFYYDQDFSPQEAMGCGHFRSDSTTHDVHIEKALSICDARQIRSKKFKVVLDSVNGAGCVVTPMLLERLDCQLVTLNPKPTGLFAHEPEPTAENLTDLGPAVNSAGADIGFAQDPDADRLAVVDEQGVYIGEEYTLALAAKYIFNKKKGKAAVNLSTSRMIDDLAQQAGCEVLRTPVGEAHVAGAMVENDCIIGGEGNGGVIDLRVVPVRDSLVGIVLILQLMAETGKKLSELVAEIPSYTMLKTKFSVQQGQSKTLLEKVTQYYQENPVQDIQLDQRDGIRIDSPDGWVQARASNTEPIIRIIAEAGSEKSAQEKVAQIRRVMGI